MRRAIVSVAVILFATALSVAAGQDPDSGKITLVVQYLPTRDRAVTPDQKAILAIADAFREKHPNVELLPFEGLDVGGIGTMDSGPLMAMAGGVAPEVMYVNFRQSETYISQSFLYPLDDYVEKWRKEPGAGLDKLIPPQVWQVIKRKGPDGKEHIWSIPYGVVVMALQYRKDLFKRAGLDPNHPPEDWKQMYDYALRICDPDQGIYGIGLYTKASAAWNFMSFLWSAGSDAVIQDDRGEWRAAYDDEGAVKAVDYYWQLRKGKWTRCPDDREPVVFGRGEKEARCPKCGRTFDAEALSKDKKLYEGVVDGDPAGTLGWQRGKIGMMFQYLYDQYIAQVNPNQVGIARVPKGPSGESHSEINSTMYGINATIKDPRVRDAAWEFIKFYASTEARRIKTRAFIEAGFAKYVSPTWLKEFGYDAYLREVPRGWEDVLKATIRDSKPEPYGKNCQLIYIEMTRPLEEVIQLDDPQPDEIRAILKKDVAETNAKLMGRVPPDVQRARTLITLLVVIFIAVVFTLLMRTSLAHYSRQIRGQSSAAQTQTVGYKRRRNLYAWLVLLPAICLIALWQYYPLARGSIMAFQDYKIIAGAQWAGLRNFSDAIFSKDFWLTMYRTAWYAVLMLTFGFCTPIGLALLLHEVPRGKVLFRTLYYLPAVTTGVVIYMLWRQFYDPSPAGFLNRVYGPAAEIIQELLVLIVAGLAIGLAVSFWRSRGLEPDRLAWWMVPVYGFLPPLIYAHLARGTGTSPAASEGMSSAVFPLSRRLRGPGGEASPLPQATEVLSAVPPSPKSAPQEPQGRGEQRGEAPTEPPTEMPSVVSPSPKSAPQGPRGRGGQGGEAPAGPPTEMPSVVSPSPKSAPQGPRGRGGQGGEAISPASRFWRAMNAVAAVVWLALAVFVLVRGVMHSGVWVLLVAGACGAAAYLAFTQRTGRGGLGLPMCLGGLVLSAAALAVIAYGVRHVWPDLFKADTQDFLNDASPIFGIPFLPAVAMVCVIFPQIWAGMGPGCIIYLAAMRAIPEEMYEAADLDGAGFWSKFWTITVPFLKALIIINFVGAFIGAFRGFEPIFILTAGGPANATTVLGLEIWRNAYMYLKYGFAVSMAWMLGSLLIGFTVLQLRILSRLEFRTASAKE